MLKDDRMMSMLTFVVILFAVGTAAQRFDVLERFLGGGSGALQFQRDEVIVSANILSNIDVLANDMGVREGDADKLVIVEQPKCGRVSARDGQVQYLPAERCVGSQIFKYAISGRSFGETGEVAVVVRVGEPTQNQVPNNAQRDVTATASDAPAVTEQSVGDTPTPLAAQPQARSDLGGLIIRSPTAPQPQAPTVAGLPNTGAGAGSATVGETGTNGSGLALGNPGQSSSDATTAGSLVTQSGAQAPVQSPPAVPTSGQNAGPRNGGTDSVTLAMTDPPSAGAGQSSSPRVQLRDSRLEANVARANPSEIGAGAADQSGLGATSGALASVQSLGGSAGLASVDTTPPAGLANPNLPASAAPVPTVPCTVLPALTLDIRPAGITEVIIDSPCHAGTVAELTYETMRFGIPLDAAGAGSINAAGFQQASDANLRFGDGAGLSFNIPFSDTEKMDRIALVRDMPFDLELNAFEFGALPGGTGHINAENPRGHRDVRRSGGGYLLGYRPLNGVGQSIDIYTYWHRSGGKAGVVKLKLGIPVSDATARSAVCGDNALSQPNFSVMRSNAGHLERPRLLRIAPIDCEALTVAGTTNQYISDAVDDLIILQK